MSSKSYQIHVQKEQFKFSAAHMTVFPDGTKEPLHGHNYTTHVSIDLRDVSLKSMVSFAYYKSVLKGICSEWNSRVLIARNCPFLTIKVESGSEFEFLLCGKRYVIPRDEVVLLDIENASTECLAGLFLDRFLAAVEPKFLGDPIVGITVTLEETAGQGATASWAFPQEFK